MPCSFPPKIAFGAIGRIYGEAARRPITGITLMAGFASTVGWPGEHRGQIIARGPGQRLRGAERQNDRKLPGAHRFVAFLSCLVVPAFATVMEVSSSRAGR
ncbi:hypothetical protein [Bradyrhizobium sp. Ai1a-2]|uniref:hypothetical protein n=1 Tax=Bradyrhizobium sp. Ai1a-2 TaxID=196490 RepID=UPI00041703DC|nr:hypothetical protein [Bradyrhizobium sp. Ai1a-2]